MLRLSRLADYAVVVIVGMAGQTDPASAISLANITDIPEPTVAKVLKLLTAGNILKSRRGSKGGYLLERSLDEISVGEVIETIDGPILLAPCSESDACDKEETCSLSGSWFPVAEAIRKTLYRISLADMTLSRGSAAEPSGLLGCVSCDGRQACATTKSFF